MHDLVIICIIEIDRNAKIMSFHYCLHLLVPDLRGPAGLITCCLPWCVKLPGGPLKPITTYPIIHIIELYGAEKVMGHMLLIG